MRLREKQILDVRLTEQELKKVKKGYRVYKLVHGCNIAVYQKGKDRKVQRVIDKLKARIKELEARK